jgi:hypothetical protein
MAQQEPMLRASCGLQAVGIPVLVEKQDPARPEPREFRRGRHSAPAEEAPQRLPESDREGKHDHLREALETVAKLRGTAALGSARAAVEWPARPRFRDRSGGQPHLGVGGGFLDRTPLRGATPGRTRGCGPD